MELISVGLVGATLGIATLGYCIDTSKLPYQFYKGYFDQKQINRGNDPRDTLRELFPILWRIM